MTFLAPIVLVGWVPLTIILFFILKPHIAVMAAIIGGWLLLPVITLSFQGMPEFHKSTSIAAGIILGGWISGQRQKLSCKWSRYDLFMIAYCLFPFITSLTNDLGSYNGISDVFTTCMVWGVPYYSGRIYFDSVDKLRDLCMGLIIGGLIYLPLCLYEIRMSPQLSRMLYGVFPHSFSQMMRYGGFRPMVFMHHGLMVSLWMAITTTAAVWFWKDREVTSLCGIPFSWWVVIMVVTSILCKSANGWISLSLGISFYILYAKYQKVTPLMLLLLMIPIYAIMRVSEILTGTEIVHYAAKIFDEERVDSLAIRLLQEDLFTKKALLRPFFGWGGYNRGWPTDPVTGERLISMIDSMWLINFSQRGLFGLFMLFFAMLAGPFLLLRFAAKAKKLSNPPNLAYSVLLSLSVVLFMLDSLVNSMINPVYILVSGALLQFWINCVDAPRRAWSTDRYRY